ncbi:unnamed protein product [Ranitomeya imitator]|uniref:Uncharacterized protein n=1 Tax=Ranitomeya imitator TaxID=111125 RepID=A0ABN9LQE0_9NEOB|nr:unnamed protein product [Ranitomeya imitator]
MYLWVNHIDMDILNMAAEYIWNPGCPKQGNITAMNLQDKSGDRMCPTPPCWITKAIPAHEEAMKITCRRQTPEHTAEEAPGNTLKLARDVPPEVTCGKLTGSEEPAGRLANCPSTSHLIMLELDVLEQRPLINPLESSASRTITHRWPALHVPFIHELKIGSDPGSLDQLTLQVNVQETLAEIGEDTKFIPEPDLFSIASVNDTGKHLGVNTAVMLDAVEKVTPVEICDSAQNMMLQESAESTDLPIREDFLNISIARDVTNQFHVKDDHALSDPISKMTDKAAGMEVMGTGSVLQSERVVNLPSEPHKDESSGLEISHSVEILTKTVSLASTKTQASVDDSPEGFLHDNCTVLKSQSHQCPAYSTKQGDSVKCLEAEHLTSTHRTFDFSYSPKVPPHFHGTSICKEAEFICIHEVNSTTSLMERLEPNTTDINVPSNMDMALCLESVQQEIEITSSEEIQNNDISVTYLSGTSSSETVSTRLDNIQSDSSKVGPQDDKSMFKNESTFLEDLEEVRDFKPNLQPCFQNLTGAKDWDTELMAVKQKSIHALSHRL